MADFNPQLPRADNTDDFINRSRGVEPLKATQHVSSGKGLSTLFEGLGNIVQQTVDTFDIGIRRDIDDRARTSEDDIFNEFGVNDVTTIEGTDVKNEPIPQEISRAEKNLAKLTQAMKQGNINENTYWARVNSVSRQLRSRYPGHRDYIDQRVSSIFGGKPQNQILSNMLQEAARANSQADSDRNKYLTLYAKANEDGALPPGFQPEQAPTVMELIQVTAPFYRNKAKREVEISTLTLDKNRTEKQGRDALQSATDYALDEAVRMTTGVTAQFGKDFNDLTKTLSEASKNKRDLTQEETAGLRSKFSELKRTYSIKLENDIAQNYGSVLTPEDRKKAIDQGMAPIMRLEEALVNKDYGALHALAANLEVQRTEDDRTLLYGYPEVRGYSAIQRALGPQAAEIFLSSTEGVRAARDKVAVEFAVGGLFGTKESSIKEVQDDLVGKGKYTPAVGRAILGSQIKIVGDDRVPLDVRAKASRTLFGPGNREYIAALKTEDKIQAFNTIVSGDMYNHMKTLRDAGYQQEWENFMGWSDNAFGGITKIYSDILKNAPAVVTSYNAETNQFDVSLDPKEAKNIPMGVPFMPSMNRIPQEVLDNQAKLNGAIRSMLPLIKERGIDPAEYMRRQFGRLGTPENVITGGVGVNKLRGDQMEDFLNEDEKIRATTENQVKNQEGWDRKDNVTGTGIEMRELMQMRAKAVDNGDYNTWKMIDNEIRNLRNSGNPNPITPPEDLDIPLVPAPKPAVRPQSELRSRTPSTREVVMDTLTGFGMGKDYADKLGTALEFAIGPMNTTSDLALAGLTLVPGTGAALKVGGKLAPEALRVIENNASKIARGIEQEIATFFGTNRGAIDDSTKAMHGKFMEIMPELLTITDRARKLGVPEKDIVQLDALPNMVSTYWGAVEQVRKRLDVIGDAGLTPTNMKAVEDGIAKVKDYQSKVEELMAQFATLKGKLKPQKE